MKKPIKINNLLNTGAQSRLLAQARLLADLDIQLQTLLAPPLQQHCRVLALREPVLVLAADSPVWAALRLRSIRVRVRPPETRSAVELKPARRRGHRDTTAIQQAAETVSDPALKTSLLKLASRHARR